jgi:hypothetical protein
MASSMRVYRGTVDQEMVVVQGSSCAPIPRTHSYSHEGV